MKTKQNITMSEKFDQFPTTNLLELAITGSAFYRAHALSALARRSIQDEILLDQIVQGITDSKNIQARVMGTISVSHIVIASLLQTNQPKAKEKVKNLLETWPESDRSDLLWFLKSEGISPE